MGLSSLRVYQYYLEDEERAAKLQMGGVSGPHPQSFSFSGSPTICVYNKLPKDAAGPGTSFEMLVCTTWPLGAPFCASRAGIGQAFVRHSSPQALLSDLWKSISGGRVRNLGLSSPSR